MNNQAIMDLDLLEQLAQSAQQRAAQATEGPWTVEGEVVEWQPGIGTFDPRGASIAGPKAFQVVVEGGLQDEQGGAVGVLKQADAQFIASARTDVPDLAAIVLMLSAEIRVLRAKAAAQESQDPQ